MPRSRRTRATVEALLLLLALAVGAAAQAKQADRNQPININANAFAGSQDSGKITFTGNVTLDQGSFHADGAQATGYTDPNDTSQWQRVVLTGTPAHFHQTQDSGSLVSGEAQTVDYQVSANTVILTGNASVKEQGQGEFHGNRLVYNTDSGQIEGTPTAGGRVHITLQPRTKPAPASAKAGTPQPPASAPGSATAAPAPAAPASAAPTSATPASPAPASSAPASSASAGAR